MPSSCASVITPAAPSSAYIARTAHKIEPPDSSVSRARQWNATMRACEILGPALGVQDPVDAGRRGTEVELITRRRATVSAAVQRLRSRALFVGIAPRGGQVWSIPAPCGGRLGLVFAQPFQGDEAPIATALSPAQMEDKYPLGGSPVDWALGTKRALAAFAALRRLAEEGGPASPAGQALAQILAADKDELRALAQATG